MGGFDESLMSYSTFKSNLALIREHNAAPGASWEMDANEFAGMTWEDFSKHHLMSPQKGCNGTHGHSSSSIIRSGVAIPDSLDWRNKSVVTAVKNQGQCGS